jgi:hypothetical protein
MTWAVQEYTSLWLFFMAPKVVEMSFYEKFVMLIMESVK